jgi:hypothetical protein
MEVDELKDYLLTHRVISISLQGEVRRNEPGKKLTLREDINIDRICDGLRSVFRDEFQQDREKRLTKGLAYWKKRKMIKIRNYFFNYFTSVAELDKLSLESQNELIDQLVDL